MERVKKTYYIGFPFLHVGALNRLERAYVITRVLDYVQKHNLESHPPLLKNELAPEIRAIKENAKPQACSSFPIAPFYPKAISSEEVFLAVIPLP